MSSTLFTGTSNHRIAFTSSGQGMYVSSQSVNSPYWYFLQYCTPSSDTWSCETITIAGVTSTTSINFRTVVLDSSDPQKLYIGHDNFGNVATGTSTCLECGTGPKSFTCTNVPSLTALATSDGQIYSFAFDSSNNLYASTSKSNKPVIYKCSLSTCATFALTYNGGSIGLSAIHFNPRFAILLLVYYCHYYHYHHPLPLLSSSTSLLSSSISSLISFIIITTANQVMPYLHLLSK